MDIAPCQNDPLSTIGVPCTMCYRFEKSNNFDRIKFLQRTISVLIAAPTILKYSRQLSPIFTGRIVGGNDTTIEQHPWQISMTNFGSHRCGGSILTPTKIVTAAHCVRGVMIPYVGIRAGSSLRTTGGVQIQVIRIIEHEDYNVPIYFDNDIALMFLESGLVFGSGIQPIALPPQGLVVAHGTDARVSGWGALTREFNFCSDVVKFFTQKNSLY